MQASDSKKPGTSSSMVSGAAKTTPAAKAVTLKEIAEASPIRIGSWIRVRNNTDEVYLYLNLDNIQYMEEGEKGLLKVKWRDGPGEAMFRIQRPLQEYLK